MDDTDPSATPLDLLLNAITEDGEADQDDFPAADHAALGDLGGLLGDSVYDFSPIDNRSEPVNDIISAEDAPPDPGREEKLRNAITQLVLSDAVGISSDGVKTASTTRMSSIQVWHPTAGQKSYKKERRLILPPPFVRASGPILSLVTSLTLSAVPIAAEHASPSEAYPRPSSSQSRRIFSSIPTEPIASPPPLDEEDSHLSKRAKISEKHRLFKEAAGRSGYGLGLRRKAEEQSDKDREMLERGITYPGLWIGGGEEQGKMTTFRLVLDIHTETAVTGCPEGDAEAKDRLLTRDTVADTATLGDIDMTSSDYNLDPSLSDLGTLHDLSTSHSPITPISIPPVPSTPNAGEAWSTLSSSPITVITKPSVKTAKSRSKSSCLSETSSFALWVRINAQAVRTKYLMLDDSPNGERLTSRTGHWTPFRFEVVKRAGMASDPSRFGAERLASTDGEDDAASVLTYGSIVRLVDVHKGTKSEAVKLVKVEKNEVVFEHAPRMGPDAVGDEDEEDEGGNEDGQPISELQRLGMIRVDEKGNPVLENGKRLYLAAPGARLGGGDLRESDERKWVWIGRGRKIVGGGDFKAGSIEGGGPSATLDPSSPPRPLTLDEAVMEELNEEALAYDFRLPDSITDGRRGDVDISGHMPMVGLGLRVKAGVSQKADEPVARRKTKRDALAAAVAAEGEEGGNHTVCTWQAAERRFSEREVRVGKKLVKSRAEVEYVKDWMCWTITGVAEFSHTFFDPSPFTSPPSRPKSISPAPRLLLPPSFHNPTTLQLTLSSLFSSTTSTSRPVPLSVYVGPIGPLTATTWRSSWRTTSHKYRTHGPAAPCLSYDGEVASAPPEDEDGEAPEPEGEQVTSSFPALVEHVIVLVELPKSDEVLRVVQSLREQMKERTMAEGRDALATSHPNVVDAPSTLDSALAEPLVTPSAPPTSIPAPAGMTAQDDAAWMDAMTGYDHSDVDGNEAIRQALQSVSQAAEADAVSEAQAEAEAGTHSRHAGQYNQEEGAIDPDLLEIAAPATPEVDPKSHSDVSGSTAKPAAGRGLIPGRPAIVVSAAGPSNSKVGAQDGSDQCPLPLLLVRRDSEMVFGLGTDMVIEQNTEEGADEYRYRIVGTPS